MATIEVDFYNFDNTCIVRRSNSAGPATTLIDNSKSPFVSCGGVLRFRGDVKETVTWPDGETSSPTDTFTLSDSGPVGPDSRWTGAAEVTPP